MYIAKKLTLYKTERHRENLPVNRKYGYYSDTSTFSLTEPYANYHHRYKKRFVQEISLMVDDKNLQTSHARKALTKYNHIKKCIIQPLSCCKTLPSPLIYTRKGFRRTFTILKRIKELKLYFSGQFQPRACKSLLLLNKLETLSLPLFSYSENSNNKAFFTAAIKLATKRRSWKSFKSLNIQLSSSISHRRLGFVNGPLQRLFGWMQHWKRYCWDIYKCATFQLELSPGGESLHLLTEIARIAPSLTRVHGCEVDRFQIFSNMLTFSSGLKAILLTFHQILQKEPCLGLLRMMPNVQELTLDVSEDQSLNLFNCKGILAQIQTLKNLTTLSLIFHSMPSLPLWYQKQAELPKLISDLINLKSLELVFGDALCYERPRGENCGLWLKDVFKAIAERSKLEKLSLSFSTFNFGSNSSSIWKALLKSLQKLTDLSVLKLEMRVAILIGNEDVLALSECIGRMVNLQDLTLKISKEFYFKANMLLALFDSFVNNLPLLSRLDLKMSCVRTTHESAQYLAEIINKMKCLNWISLDLTGEIKGDLDLKTFKTEINKKIPGNICHTKVY